jgi:hypothetical protein
MPLSRDVARRSSLDEITCSRMANSGGFSVATLERSKDAPMVVV